MRKWIFRVAALALIGGVGAAAAWYMLRPVVVELVMPTRGPAVRAVYGSGTVEPIVMLPIAPKVAGRLQRLLVDESSQVSKGAVLAQLDNRELTATVAEWEARVRYSQAQYERANRLFRNRIGTAAARDRAKSELDTALAARARAHERVGEMRLIAPADGVIIRRDGEVGQLFQPGQTLFWMSCCDSLRVTAEIDEEDIPAVRPGQRVVIHADAFPGITLEGAVTEITPKGDPISRSFRVRIKLPVEQPLMIGMTADCNIVVEERPDALLVPASAVLDGAVWLLVDGRLARRTVTLGILGQDRVEVTSGLAEGEQIVARPDDEFREGRRAHPRGARRQ